MVAVMWTDEAADMLEAVLEFGTERFGVRAVRKLMRESTVCVCLQPIRVWADAWLSLHPGKKYAACW